MAKIIQLKRGLEADLPSAQLAVAELAFTTDTKKLFVGAEGGNVQVPMSAELEAKLTEAKAHTDAEIITLRSDVTAEIAAAVAAVTFENATVDADGLMSKEDKAIVDSLAQTHADLQAAIDAAETTEGAQAKADAALAASKTYTDEKVSGLVNSAPEALDTLGELATALQEVDGAYDALLEVVGGKAAEVHTHNAADIVDSEEKRFVSDALIASWNAKAEVGDVDTSIATAVDAAKAELTTTVEALDARIEAIENETVLDGGTF